MDSRGHYPASEESQNPRRIYRIDKFAVPDSVRREFIEKVRETHEFLRTLPGFIEDSIFEKAGGSGVFDVVTIAARDGPEAVEAAREAMISQRQKTGFDPREMFARLEIRADLANYERTDGSMASIA